MFAQIAPQSTAALAVLAFCLVLVLAFEFSNGFHDTANAVATVIYTQALKPVVAVMLSGAMNFLGVLLGGVAVAFTLVELLPPDVLTPPDGNPAIAMLLSIFLAALAWNVATWALGIPCSSSHAIIGSLLGIAIVNSLVTAHDLGNGVDWSQVWSVGRALLFSPIIGFILAGLLFAIFRRVIHDRVLFEPTKPGEAPRWWVRCLLILTCSGVSFAHGSNDGQKSIGLIMLTIIGLFPAHYTLNFNYGASELHQVSDKLGAALPLIERYGDGEKDQAMQAGHQLIGRLHGIHLMTEIPERLRSSFRDNVYRVDAELKLVGYAKAASEADKKTAADTRTILRGAVEYAPDWVRALSALCLGLGTMVGYRRIVVTLGERIGQKPLVPAQGASAELVAAGLIGTAGFSGLPVSTTHIVSSGIAGTMAEARAGLKTATLRSILIAWVLTLPATILLAGGAFYLLGEHVPGMAKQAQAFTPRSVVYTAPGALQ